MYKTALVDTKGRTHIHTPLAQLYLSAHTTLYYKFTVCQCIYTNAPRHKNVRVSAKFSFGGVTYLEQQISRLKSEVPSAEKYQLTIDHGQACEITTAVGRSSHTQRRHTLHKRRTPAQHTMHCHSQSHSAKQSLQSTHAHTPRTVRLKQELVTLDVTYSN
ncbi:hypothetical protein BaRGS_00032696 [Batillaria attramentaria]|uniref:Uncharacterized protein n=1 Tax=Batillaria attramentaria TaxID=370345 RepID=A0ABD0JMK7_9CAEN